MLALLTLTLAAGSCLSGQPIQIQPTPPLDPELARRCYDPGSVGEAFADWVRTRQAWADCAGRHAAVVDAWPASGE